MSSQQEYYDLCRSEIAVRVRLMQNSNTDKKHDIRAELESILERKHELKKIVYKIGD